MRSLSDRSLRPRGVVPRCPAAAVFPAALLGRLVVVPYYPISDEVLKRIIELQLGRIRKRLAENQKIPFTYEDEVKDLIKSRCTELESGARMVDAILTHTLLPSISQEYLTTLMEGQTIEKVHVSVKDGEFSYAFS